MGDDAEETFSPAESARSLALGAVGIAAVGVADLLLAAEAGARPFIWAGWVAGYLAAALASLRLPRRVAASLAVATSVLAVAAVLALAAVGDGVHSPFFLMLPMVPLITALVAPGQWLNPALQGLLATAGGAALLRQHQQGWDRVAVWVIGSLVATGFALAGARRASRRQAALLRAHADRAEVQARLAEAERRRAETERWVTAGHLADQVAHDVNSPLASLRANLKFVREELPGADPEILQAVADGEEAIEEIREAVSSLKVRTLPPRQRGAG